MPYAFTEHGAVMLASVLNSDRAILVNIQIVRVFNKMRRLLENHSEILKKLEQLFRNDREQDHKIRIIFEYIRQMEEVKAEEKSFNKRRRIGY